MFLVHMYLYFIYQSELIMLRHRDNIKMFLIYNLIFTAGIIASDPEVPPIGIDFLTSHHYLACF